MDDRSTETASEQLLIEVPRGESGIEVLRAVPVPGGAYRVLSVPVFVYGISRDSVVVAAPGPRERLCFAGVRTPSPGATIRASVSPTTTPRHVDDDYFKGPIGHRLGLGPATLLEPTTIAIHLRDRSRMADATRYFDGLIRLGVLTGWEFADPGAPSGSEDETPAPPWELVHPPATEPEAPETTP